MAGAFSFYPTKNLGALGDGGAIVTNDRALADRVKRLRNGGQTDRYHHVEPGVNSRLDEIQAAVLRARLPRLAAWTGRRRALAARYRDRLAGAPVTAVPERDPGHVYHLFVVRAAGDARGGRTRDASAGPSGVARHRHPDSLPVADSQSASHRVGASRRVSTGGRGLQRDTLASTPSRPLDDAEVDEIAAAVGAFDARTIAS